MESTGISEFHVFDGLQSITKSKYDNQLTYVENTESESANERKTSQAVK